MAVERFAIGQKDSATAKLQEPKKLPVVLERARDQAIASLEKLFVHMLDTADDVLFDLADKATNNKDQTQYFEAMRELRIRRKGMESVFHQEIHHSFTAATNHNVAGLGELATSYTLDSLSLVKEDELEDNLAIEGMATRAQQRNDNALRILAQRYRVLLGDNLINSENLPLHPKALSEAMRSASKTMVLDIKSKLVVYKLFERATLAELPQVYAELNGFLSDSGVLPELQHNQPKKPSSYAPAPRARSESAIIRNEYGEQEVTGPTPIDVRSEIFMAMRELLAIQKGPAQSDSGFGVPLMPMVETQQLLNALSTMQIDAGNNARGQLDVRTVLASRLPVTGTKVDSAAIGAVNDDVIDVVSMLFDFILGENNLRDEIRAQLARLQIPMLKVAIADKTFFSNRNHPARTLLNEMAYAGLGWDPAHLGRDDLPGKIEAIVARVLKEFESNLGLFDELLIEFRQFVDDEKRRSVLLEKRTREAEDGKARTEMARTAAAEVVARVCIGKRVPASAELLLNEVWSRVLVMECLRNGSEGEAFVQCSLTAENLIRSVTASDAAERQQLPKILPQLIRDLRAGFDLIALPAQQATKYLKDLQTVHFALLRPTIENVDALLINNAPAAAPAQHGAASNNEIDVLADALPDLTGEDTTLLNAFDLAPEPVESALDIEVALTIEDRWLDQVDGLPIGSWIDVRSGDEKSLRCKLGAKIPMANKFIFVNRSGMKVAEYTRITLAQALKYEQVSVIDDSALFDRALLAVVSNLRKLKADT